MTGFRDSYRDMERRKEREAKYGRARIGSKKPIQPHGADAPFVRASCRTSEEVGDDDSIHPKDY